MELTPENVEDCSLLVRLKKGYKKREAEVYTYAVKESIATQIFFKKKKFEAEIE
jgi:hypothetical protein